MNPGMAEVCGDGLDHDCYPMDIDAAAGRTVDFGDLDNDGVLDVVVGAYNAGVNDEGTSHFFPLIDF